MMEGDVLRTRMERYSDDQEEAARTKKNQNLYEDMYSNVPSSNVAVLNNESEIDVSKIKELVQNREGYKRLREYESIIKTPALENDEEEYDIYEDIDNKIYDINMILEDAKSKRGISEREKYHNLKNTQYNILSKLDLNEQTEVDDMVTDFFTQDKTIKELMTSINAKGNDKITEQSKTTVDLFDTLKGDDNTILTEAVQRDKIDTRQNKTDDDTAFYTANLNFTKEDFEGFQNLQTTVKKNNRLIKLLISILVIILLSIVAVMVITML